MARKPKQTDLPIEGPGVAPVTIQEIETLADAYATARDARMKKSDKEVEAKLALIAVLHAHADKIGKNPDTGEIRYIYNGGEKEKRVITLKPSEEKLNVKDVEAFEEEDVT